ncbi:MAG: DUF1667 domain-containing protein [Methanobacteriota archaeon]
MTHEQEITCIVCPIGCKIKIQRTTNEKTVEILPGNKCKKGIEYVKTEVCDPRRVLTTSILVKNGEWPLLSVKTSQPLPKDKIFTVLHLLQKTSVPAPIKKGQIIIRNIANTKIHIIATKTVEKRIKK